MNTVSLWRVLADAALETAGQPAGAVSALMRAASAILEDAFGPEQAAHLMLSIVSEAAGEASGTSGLMATKH